MLTALEMVESRLYGRTWRHLTMGIWKLVEAGTQQVDLEVTPQSHQMTLFFEKIVRKEDDD